MEGPTWEQVLNQGLPVPGGRGGQRGVGSVGAYAPCWWNRGRLLQWVGSAAPEAVWENTQSCCVSPRSPKKPSPRVGIKRPRSLFGGVIMWEKVRKELETLRESPGRRASLNLSEGERESVKWSVLDNPPPRPIYHLSSSPWKVRQSHWGSLQPVSLRRGLTSLPESGIVWELGALGAFCSDPKDPSYNTHTQNPLGFLGSSIKPQMVKKLPATQDTRFLSFFLSFFFISWRLITLQYCSGFCHTLKRTSHGFTCVPHPDSPSHLPLHPIPLGLPSAPGPSTCLMHPTWAGDLFH